MDLWLKKNLSIYTNARGASLVNTDSTAAEWLQEPSIVYN